ncbi:MAG: 2-oxoacid:ferredoxin oxidoreductase subunit beta [Hydrogenobaculum sp.]|jgi:2-oxoacid:acceptor oxidoreductase, beta subunit, pyruvate/2-ketoisovalerate family|uniref:2-oxoacid:ferredoxin oxidoreductase subunit beta n=1 Tax=unclassified Hydrogenobaculum TaxID=2622382 RepID=UPI0001C51A2D|nr:MULTISPECIES: 2-oxoacid:ferredoxin oxidoreductase subunit beta [unclassified Hydrogenobaculum]AEF19792.1 pyruvate ferredoxin/flavodoxin oxidoreductase, beta subunit [Hydrogenobaculum sp. 3684]AEG47079.1 pyruvate ferredoxin/flavodoxin oxidoreductase, beta subunit [Hydrogenobaculum sp. SHO]AGG15727.1 pyruvate ferredoxin/flavodoxin oxidoreductase, beta subunit [Hydrogenobaculum sp. HO]AGH94027.1 2-oxoacid:acceptor oxidoreductase, beta subunit, pyruvate/2-ketoisovalerate family [Hydrogenobaculum
MEQQLELQPADYRSDIEPTWCPGCGDFGVISAITKALSELKIRPENVVSVSGIGCSSRAPLFLKNYSMHVLHGRAIPTAIGVKIANPDLTVLVEAGDGDLFSIGSGHNPHAARRNIDITVLCMDNQVYGLTKNQISPTSREGLYGSLTPYGSIDKPINPISYMLTFGATFVAQTYAGNLKHMSDIIKKAISHRGFSFVNIISPCPTYNKVDTFKYYKDKTIDINEQGHNELDNLQKALELAMKDLEHYYNESAKVPIGIFYQKEEPTYQDRVKEVKTKYKASKDINPQVFIDECKVLPV